MDDGRKLNHIELLTIAEKDGQYFNEFLRDDAQELAQRLLGIRKWIQFRNLITNLSRFCYFSMTTLLNNTTPGEEFCEAEPTKEIWNRLLMVILNSELQLPGDLQRFARLLKDMNLVTFYLFGDSFEFAKRVANFSYSSYAQDISKPRDKLTYKILGIMTLIRLALTNTISQPQPETPTSAIITPKNNDIACPLCSGQRSHPTSTTCGHIFCWNCIHQWLKERTECPICRTATDPSRLIYLINFR